MGVLPCFETRTVSYITKGNVISVNIRAEDQEYSKPIRIHEVNKLRKAIQLYQEQINKKHLKIKKAIYEPEQRVLPLDKALNELEINFSSNIIVYLY